MRQKLFVVGSGVLVNRSPPLALAVLVSSGTHSGGVRLKARSCAYFFTGDADKRQPQVAVVQMLADELVVARRDRHGQGRGRAVALDLQRFLQ